MKEIIEIKDIQLLVNSFYSKVRKDVLLKDIFNNAIGEKWDEHLEKLSRFWQTVLLGEHTYYGSPFVHHANLPINKTHFDRWLKLFYETIDEHFTGDKAAEAKTRAGNMAEMFQYKLEYYKTKARNPLV